MPFGELVKAGVRHAREGIPVSAMHAYMFKVLEPIITHYPEAAALYAPEGRLLREGEVFRFPDLGDALERLGADGPAWLYEGETCERICDWINERGGALHPDDFSAYEVIERAPVEAAYRGRQVLTNAPPSSGGILIAYALDLLEHSGGPLEPDDPDALALLAEVMDEAQRARAGDFHDRLHTEGFAERVPVRGPPRAGAAARGLEHRLAPAEQHARDRRHVRFDNAHLGARLRRQRRERHMFERHRLGRDSAGHRRCI